METNSKFKICITMAGAVSAGAFTGGVMDYILETLELWEQAKQKNRSLGTDHPSYDFTVPMHDVELDVISGASAGGITGSLTLLNVIDETYRPVNKDNPLGQNNRFYQSWVVMGDDAESDTFEKLLAADDLKKGEQPESLLNSKPIDSIADKALVIAKVRAYPPYISNSLDLILTTTNLRGINFKIDFGGNDQSGSVITSHAGFFRYKLANEHYKTGIPDGEELYYVLDLSDTKEMNYLKDATLSTAAFPIGLKSREVAISQKYVERYPKYLFGKRQGIYPLLRENSVYKFNSIDGGLINNEPFAIALKVLKEKNPVAVAQDRYAVVMIDPFPNQDNDVEPNNPKRDIISIAKGMFKALRNQVMFNQDGILDALEVSDRTKFLVEPVRKIMVQGSWARAKSDLASAPFSGFTGFIDQSFRKHDYHLGRLNGQSFLRYYFGVTETDLEARLGTVPDARAFERFYIHESKHDTTTVKVFPIIPDMRLLKARTNESDSVTYGTDATLQYPEYPKIVRADFEKKYKSQIKKRIELVANALVGNFWFSLANRLFLRKRIYDGVNDMILKELEEAGLTESSQR
ncbi:hypothetical protein FK004_12480 [Flavobacterium kingsejongi]|uniref:PNPLA domain-containing protein n=2 Tax=Flavobacterium kingsejongi TaxID=1678728 RepID=A0A2S1LQI6_9FLAO|nr:hypothetical protein FK004_12480 [Flavobacterium kingsejongi]